MLETANKIARFIASASTRLVQGGVVCLAAACLFSGCHLSPGSGADAGVGGKTGSLKNSLQAAERAQRPYLVESVTVLVQIEDQPRERRSTYRYVYTLRPLRDITRQDRTFQEELHNYFGREQHYWPGSGEQVNVKRESKAVSYDVVFSAGKGDLYTVVTGMTLVEDLPLGPRQVRSFQFDPRHYSVFYPNSEDYIAQLTLVVSSSTTDLHLEEQSAWRQKKAGATPEFLPARRARDEAGGTTTLSTRFHSLVPGETVGLKYAW